MQTKDLQNTSLVLNVIFADWRNAGTELKKQIENAPALMEAKQLASDLQTLGEIGLETTGFLQTGKTSSAEWRAAKLKMLVEIGQQKAALEFQVIESMKILVNATAGN